MSSRQAPHLGPLRGFTLVEVLIALTLFSLILGSLYGGLYAMSRSWRTTELKQGENDAYRLGLDFLRKSIEQAVPLALLKDKSVAVIFAGESRKLSWVAPLPSHAGGYGLYRLRLYVMGNALQLGYVPAHPDFLSGTPDESGAIEVISLLDDVSSIEMEYHGAVEADVPASWHGSWQQQNKLPDAVRLNIRRKKASGRNLELVIPLHAQFATGHPELVIYENEKVSGLF